MSCLGHQHSYFSDIKAVLSTILQPSRQVCEGVTTGEIQEVPVVGEQGGGGGGGEQGVVGVVSRVLVQAELQVQALLQGGKELRQAKINLEIWIAIF